VITFSDSPHDWTFVDNASDGDDDATMTTFRTENRAQRQLSSGFMAE